jgi:predicted CoA-binding protein
MSLPARRVRDAFGRGGRVSEAEQILRTAGTILVVDWPSKDVPETLARTGYTVVVKGGPGPADYSFHELRDGEIVRRPAGGPPPGADLVYAHRPVDELAGIASLARQVGAIAVWYQSGLASAGTKDPHGCWMEPAASQTARTVIEAAGLTYVESPYIADEVRRLGIRK